MSDITKCEGGDCPQKDSCYRFQVAPILPLQNYFIDPPFTKDGCKHFAPMQSHHCISECLMKRLVHPSSVLEDYD